MVDAAVTGGGMNVPSRMVVAVLVLVEYPSNSNKTPWKIGALSAWLIHFDISSGIPSSAGSFIVYSCMVTSPGGALRCPANPYFDKVILT